MSKCIALNLLLALLATISCAADQPINDNAWILQKKYSITTIFDAIDKVEKINQLNYQAGCSYVVLLKVKDGQYQPITPLPNSFLEENNGHASLINFLTEGDITIHLGKSSKENCQDAWFNLENQYLSTAETHFFVHEYFHFVYQGRAVKENISRSKNWWPSESKFLSEAAIFNEDILSLYRRQRFRSGDGTKFCDLIEDWNALTQEIISKDFAYWNTMMQRLEWPADYFSWQVLHELGLSDSRFLRLVEDTDTLSHGRGTHADVKIEDKNREWTTADLFPNQYLLAALIATTSSYPLKQSQTHSEQVSPYKTLCKPSDNQ